MISVDEAFEHYRRAISRLPVDDVPLDDAHHRVLAAPVTAGIDLPPFPQSAMDGYALRAADTRAATAGEPARLRLVGTVPAGRVIGTPEVGSGEVMAIFTGGLVPVGADAILRQEDAQLAGKSLLVDRPVLAGQHLRRHGEELRAGTRLAATGLRIGPGLLGALAVAGTARVLVHRQPRIAVLTTGDEVVAAGRDLSPGEIYDANRPLVVAWLQAAGYSDVRAVHLPDDLAGTADALRVALTQSDLVITTGGVSVGERDYVLAAAREAGAREVFWRVKQKPGKPLYFGVRDSTPLIGLPGNPGAVFVGLSVHVRRVLDLLEGAVPPAPHFLAGQLGFAVVADSNRDQWLRCRWDVTASGDVVLRELPRQASHMISNLAHCTALVRIAAGAGDLTPGAVVPWIACGPPGQSTGEGPTGPAIEAAPAPGPAAP